MVRLTFAFLLGLGTFAGARGALACDCMKQQQQCQCGGPQSCVCPGMHAEPPAQPPAAQKPEKPRPKPEQKKRTQAAR